MTNLPLDAAALREMLRDAWGAGNEYALPEDGTTPETCEQYLDRILGGGK